MNMEMKKSLVNGVELEYSILGKEEEETIIFIDGGIIADANIPLFLEPSLRNCPTCTLSQKGLCWK